MMPCCIIQYFISRKELFMFTKGSIVTLALALLAGVPAGYANQALYVETFEEFDARNGGSILPEGVERSRFSGRIPATEIEIEAPAGSNGDTTSLARWIPDPSGLSLTALLLDDQDTDPDNQSLGADGAVSLLEPILLDQGDRTGRAVASWMSMAMQTDQPGGTLFPETDSAIDEGPEGLNLIGFGGVFRDFDTGDPIPDADFSGFITLNDGGTSDIRTLNVPYEAEVPVFFVLDFDLENSIYDIFINGVLVEEDVPFFDAQGLAGVTLRELEWISSARGTGAFLYDNVYQLDPDTEYQPIPHVTPLVAEDAPLIPLFLEEFDDMELGALEDGRNAGDVPGSGVTTTGEVVVVEDESLLSLARTRLSPDSSITAQFAVSSNLNDPIRIAFAYTPSAADSSLLAALGETNILRFSENGISIDENGDGVLEAQDAQQLEGLPHWVSMDLDTSTGEYKVKVYRALSPTEAQNTVLEFSGQTDAGADPLTLSNGSSEVWLDNLMLAEVNDTPNGEAEAVHRAVVAHDFESAENDSTTLGGTVVDDPTQWSLRSLEAASDAAVTLLADGAITHSARVAWNALPSQNNVETSVLSVTLSDGAAEQTVDLAGLLADGTIAALAQDGSGLASTGVSYSTFAKNQLSVKLDLAAGEWALSIDSQSGYLATGSLPLSSAVLVSASLGGQSGGTVVYDDLLVVADEYAAQFESLEYQAPALPGNAALLFEEDFENNPALSEREINEFSPRQSGLPIETGSNGFSDLAPTDVEGTRLTVGAPSSAAVYTKDPDGSSLYSLHLNDLFKPDDFSEFELAVPFNPLSTLRTVPYSLVIPELASAPTQRYVHVQWSAQALQSDETGLALFTGTQDSTVQRPAPAGSPLVAFGNTGTWLVDTDGDGELDDTGMAYNANQTYRLIATIDRQENTFTLRMNGQTQFSDVPFAGDAGAEGFLQSFGWFSTLVSSGSEQELQQDTVGGGDYIIDDILVFENDEFTKVDNFMIY